MRAAGAITLGKTNTPEFGAGSNTFNPVFGATRNPYDLAKTVRRQQRRRGGGARAAAWCRSPTAATPAARCAIRRRSATSSAFVRRRAACPTTTARGRRCRRRARWRAPSPTSRSSSARWPAATRPIRSSLDDDPARFRAPLARELQGRARRVVHGPGRHPVRAGDPRVVEREPQGLRGPRLRRRGGRAGFHRCRRGVPDAAPSRLSRAATRSWRASIPTMVKDTIKWEIAEAERNTGADVARALRATGEDVSRRRARSSRSTTTSCCR